MTTAPLLSVIVPAYNVAPWIIACMDSILQTERPYPEALQLIVVNDGSTDRTQEAIDQYRQSHPEVIVHTQKNRGLSGARNAGIRLAEGRYLAFVDGDDQWCRHASLPWQQMEEEQSEIFGLNMLQQRPGCNPVPYRRYRPQYGKVFRPAYRFMKGRNLFPSACAYLFSQRLMQRHHLSFTEGIYHEDEDFTIQAFLHAESFAAVTGEHYLYIQREESITTGQSEQKLHKRIHDLLGILQKIQTDPLSQELSDALCCKKYFLATDTLRVLLAGTGDRVFIRETLSHLRSLSLYPFPFYPNLHYLTVCLYLYIKVKMKVMLYF